MLRDIISEKGLSMYKVAKDTQIPYSTLCDLVSGKTLIENTSSNTLYRLAKYLELSMERIYTANNPSSDVFLYNEGPKIIVEFQKYKMEYLGPKNLIAFKKVNRLQDRMVCVDTYFFDENKKIYIEEEYVDLVDIFSDYGLEMELPENINIRLCKPGANQKERLLDEAIIVSDSMIVTYNENSAGDLTVLIVDINRTNLRMSYRISDDTVLFTNMSETMQKRAINAVKRNRAYICDQIDLQLENPT